LRVIENGVDVELFRRDAAARFGLRRKLGIPDAAWVVGTVGRLAPEKDHGLLLDAIAPELCDQHRLVIVGSGPEEERLRAHVSAGPAAPWVTLTGARSDVPRLLSAFDVFVLSSKTEGLPLVIPEAMAASLPVVSTAVGGIPSVVRDGETGLLVPPGDAAALRAALVSLHADRQRAHAMGTAARQLAEAQYSKQRMVSDYLALYQSHTNGRRAR
jgi:glycosyltransferase involved in cell wall biosynthesis